MNKPTKQDLITDQNLFDDVSKLIKAAQQKTLHQLNKMNVLLYWHIGKKIDGAILNLETAVASTNLAQLIG